MSDRERYSQRDLTYSRWHRQDSIRRFLSDAEAYGLGMCDLDAIEYCRYPGCGQFFAILETAQDVGQFKPTTILKTAAARMGVPAYLVYYSPDGTGDIKQFRVFEVHPRRCPIGVLTPAEYARFLVRLRVGHEHGSEWLPVIYQPLLV